MVFNSDKLVLVAISVQSFQCEPYLVNGRQAQSADIKGESTDRDSRFSIRTGLLNDEQLRRCELLKLHGSTVVELSDGYRGDNRWIDIAVHKALDRIAKRYEGTEGNNQVENYDPEFAHDVLVKVNEHFPTPVQIHELKHSFDNEPSDDRLLMALDGLHAEGLIEGKPHYSHTSSRRKLDMMANIKITKEGRQHLSPGPSTDRGVTNFTFNAPVGKVYSNSVDQSTNFTITLPNLKDIDFISEGHPELQAVAVEIRNAQQQGTSVLEKFLKWAGLVSSIEGLAEKVYQHYPQIAALIGRAAMLVQHFSK